MGTGCLGGARGYTPPKMTLAGWSERIVSIAKTHYGIAVDDISDYEKYFDPDASIHDMHNVIRQYEKDHPNIERCWDR